MWIEGELIITDSFQLEQLYIEVEDDEYFFTGNG